MKAYSSLLICGAISALVLTLAGMKVDVARADCINAQDTDWVSWDGGFDSWIHSSNAGHPSYYTFNTTQGFHWCYTTAPTNGAVEQVTASSNNVSDVAYDPEYFFPNSVGKVYTLPIVITGIHVTPTQTAKVVTLGWCWSPYHSNNRDTNIYAH